MGLGEQRLGGGPPLELAHQQHRVGLVLLPQVRGGERGQKRGAQLVRLGEAQRVDGAAVVELIGEGHQVLEAGTALDRHPHRDRDGPVVKQACTQLHRDGLAQHQHTQAELDVQRGD